jgi:hypothetical protein
MGIFGQRTVAAIVAVLALVFVVASV